MKAILALAALAAIPLAWGEDSSAYQTEIGDAVFIFVQSTLRDSDGTLVAYLESTKFTDINYPALGPFLDYESSRGNDPVVSIDGSQYQAIRRVQTQTFHADGLVASTNLSDRLDGDTVHLVRFAHDGYPTAPGDTLESIWTFLRPVVP